MNKTRYYRSFNDDFAESKNQNYKLPENYRWIRNDIISRFLSGFIYSLAFLISTFYCRIFLHVSFKNKEVFKGFKDTGIFLYGNHTQPVGDVFNPALGCDKKRIYTVVSPANSGIPVIGKILPYLGALPIPSAIKSMKKFNSAIEERIKQKKCVVIYPEAHVWEYYTDIRPFPDTSFKYPVKLNVPSFCMTVTYKKRKYYKKPKTVIFMDGPFYPNKELKLKEQAADLRDRIYDCMKERSKESNYEFIKYERLP